MSWNKVYCLFPLPTIDDHEFFPLQELGGHFGRRLTKLARQGWTTRDLVWADWAATKLPALGLRRVGDETSLQMTLRPALSYAEASPEYVLELAEFRVGDVVHDSPPPALGLFTPRSTFAEPPTIPRERSIGRALCVGVETLTSRSLAHRYVIGRKSGWGKYAEERARRWTEVEDCKETSNRSAGHDDLESLVESLAMWDYADDQMPVWYEQYCMQQGQSDMNNS